MLNTRFSKSSPLSPHQLSPLIIGLPSLTSPYASIDANQRLFDEGEAVPEKAFTMGIKSIMQSKHILLIANGEKKAQIIRDAFFGLVTPKVPASILQLHNNVTVIVDKEAGKLIKDVL